MFGDELLLFTPGDQKFPALVAQGIELFSVLVEPGAGILDLAIDTADGQFRGSQRVAQGGAAGKVGFQLFAQCGHIPLETG